MTLAYNLAGVEKFAMASGAGVNAIRSAIHIHPSLSEVVQWGL